MKRLAISMGDPAGVGPEVVVRALEDLPAGCAAVLCGPREVWAEAVQWFGSERLRRAWKRAPAAGSLARARAARAALSVWDCADYPAARLEPGVSGAAEGKAARAALDAALALALASPADTALLTAPISKASIMAAGFRHAGHTEYLGERAGAKPVMMLCSDKLRVVPVTHHIPLAEVPGALSRKLLVEAMEIVDRDLRGRWGMVRPALGVAALNPHAGEDGRLGDEEIRIIAPAIAAARKKGIEAAGPFPADTLFVGAKRRAFHALICMYHDQALIPLKALGFQSAVNVTLGLPIVRTSPGHGTAFDIAWQGRADPRSTAAAMRLAAFLLGSPVRK